MVIDEAMRLYPPAWITNRQAIADDEVCGYRIPAGAIVLVSPYVMHRHPAYWEHPDAFEPERFAPERSAGSPARTPTSRSAAGRASASARPLR